METDSSFWATNSNFITKQHQWRAEEMLPSWFKCDWINKKKTFSVQNRIPEMYFKKDAVNILLTYSWYDIASVIEKESEFLIW